MNLDIAHRHWGSQDFTIRQASTPVANIDMSWWCEKGALTVDRTAYQMYREGWMTGAYILERDGSVIARAERPSAFRRQYQIQFRDREYTLVARSAFRRGFVLLDGNDEIGSLERASWLTRDATANLPETFPLPVRAFIIWLTMIQWRRERNS